MIIDIGIPIPCIGFLELMVRKGAHIQIGDLKKNAKIPFENGKCKIEDSPESSEAIVECIEEILGFLVPVPEGGYKGRAANTIRIESDERRGGVQRHEQNERMKECGKNEVHARTTRRTAVNFTSVKFDAGLRPARL